MTKEEIDAEVVKRAKRLAALIARRHPRETDEEILGAAWEVVNKAAKGVDYDFSRLSVRILYLRMIDQWRERERDLWRGGLAMMQFAEMNSKGGTRNCASTLVEDHRGKTAAELEREYLDTWREVSQYFAGSSIEVRTAAYLHYWLGVDQKEAALMVGVHPATLNVRMRRAAELATRPKRKGKHATNDE